MAEKFVTADAHPDHDTICTFRRKNLFAISKAFVEILQLAKEMGLLRVGKVSTDGTHIKVPRDAETIPMESSESFNLTDPDARVMRKSKSAAYTQSINSQVRVDAEGSCLIFGQHISQSSSDFNDASQPATHSPKHGYPKFEGD